MVVTSGADGTCRILDPRRSFSLVSTIQLTDFAYSMAVAGRRDGVVQVKGQGVQVAMGSEFRCLVWLKAGVCSDGSCLAH